MYFASKVDWWFYALVVGLAMVVIIAVGVQVRRGRFSILGSTVLAPVALVIPVWLLFGTWYVVEDEILIIRAGPKFWEIPVVDIHGVKKSRSTSSSPALSLERIEIRYGNNQRVLVSPEDVEGFLEAIQQSIDDEPF